MKKHWEIAVLASCMLPAVASAQWSRAQLETVESFGADQRIVGTHYFYWYNYPDEHFFAAGGQDILQDHFPNPEAVSYNDPAWHAKQLQDCADAGIDFILPVYWGVVDDYFKPGVVFSVQGLGALRWALEQRTRAGKPAPKVGLFYDTSTLSPSFHDATEKLDLTGERGQDVFYRTIRDFFYQVPPRFWAAIDGCPIVVLYGSGFAGAQDQSVFDVAYDRFGRDFQGHRPYIIRDNSWQGRTDGTTAWGGALKGPSIFGDVAQIGAGYNDSAVPGRKTPIREREDGRFYRWSWNRVIEHAARIVLLETWNEMHEGTSLCESREYGRTYINLTREYADRFRRGDAVSETITLKYPGPRLRPPSDRGKEFATDGDVSVVLGKGGSAEGLWSVRGVPDGRVQDDTVGGRPCVRTPEGAHGYVYFNVADPFLWDAACPVTVTYTFWDAGFEHLELQYDSRDKKAPLDGSYKSAASMRCTGTETWKTCTNRLADARFVNRQNGGADFRLAYRGGRLAIADARVSK